VSLSILFIPYLLFLGFYALWSLVLVYHLFHFGFMNTHAVLITALHVTVSVLLLLVSFSLIATVNWDATINLGISMSPSL